MNKTTVLIDTECLIASHGSVSIDYYKALYQISEMVKEAGISPSISLCSGRSRNEVEFFASLIGNPDSWAIIENGALLLNLTTKELLSSPNLVGSQGVLYSAYRRKVPRLLKKYKGLFLYSGNSASIVLGRNPGSALTIEELCQGVKRELKTFILKRELRVANTKETITIAPYGVNKSSGVRFWALSCNIDLKKSLAIGNSRRDIPFVKRFRLIGCPNNADQSLKRFIKSKKGRVSQHSYAQGVVDIIEYYLKPRED